MIALIMAVTLASGLVQAFWRHHPHNANADEVQYLRYAHALATAGTYANTPAGPKADGTPGREPGYPVLAALIMRFDSDLSDNIERCVQAPADDAGCSTIYVTLQTANVVLIAEAAMFVYLTMALLGGSALAASVAGFYIALNFQAMREVHWMLSDCLALFLSSGLCLALAWALSGDKETDTSRNTEYRWIWVAVMMGCLTLTKAIFLYFGLLVGIGLALRFLAIRNRIALKAFLIFAIVFGCMAGGWIERNREDFGRAGITDSRGGMVLSTREVFDHMSAGEYAASFVWWMRGPGNNLARRLFDAKDWHRFDEHAPDGFYIQGLNTRYNERVDQLMREQGISQASAEAAVPTIILGEMLSRAPAYIASWLPLFFRGLWSDEFIVFGLPALIWWVVHCLRKRAWKPLAVISPALFSMIVYPALTLNLPRFQLTALPGLAIAAGMAVAALTDAWMRRRQRNRITLRPA